MLEETKNLVRSNPTLAALIARKNGLTRVRSEFDRIAGHHPTDLDAAIGILEMAIEGARFEPIELH